MARFWSFVFRSFEFVSSFVIRISCDAEMGRMFQTMRHFILPIIRNKIY
ncbi:hypothetical protein D1AOALGA4SA_335 [Olavius algarvensis Delta 1 endosymbiont]|nr:hypothetical protein D1AOALGA4SA_335 [Olavius algarvensis Delta 1 endosymbiont]